MEQARRDGERVLGPDREAQRFALCCPAAVSHVIAPRQLARELGNYAQRIPRHDRDIDPAADE